MPTAIDTRVRAFTARNGSPLYAFLVYNEYIIGRWVCLKRPDEPVEVMHDREEMERRREQYRDEKGLEELRVPLRQTARRW